LPPGAGMNNSEISSSTPIPLPLNIKHAHEKTAPQAVHINLHYLLLFAGFR